MQWQDEGWILCTKPFSERALLVEAFTQDHGKIRGMLKPARAKGQTPPQAGLCGTLVCKARLEEHLGQLTFEPTFTLLPTLFSTQSKLRIFTMLAGLLIHSLPDHHGYPSLFTQVDNFLRFLDIASLLPGLAAYVRLEVDILESLGFGLNLSHCALSGKLEDLAYVSPKSGCAATSEAGAPFKEKLLPLPAFLTRPETPPRPLDIIQGLALTGHFLESHFFQDKPQKFRQLRQGLYGVVAA